MRHARLGGDAHYLMVSPPSMVSMEPGDVLGFIRSEGADGVADIGRFDPRRSHRACWRWRPPCAGRPKGGGGAGDDEDPGVGEEDVEAAELANAVVEHLRQLRVVAHVGRSDTFRWPQDRRPEIELVMMIDHRRSRSERAGRPDEGHLSCEAPGPLSGPMLIDTLVRHQSTRDQTELSRGGMGASSCSSYVPAEIEWIWRTATSGSGVTTIIQR